MAALFAAAALSCASERTATRVEVVRPPMALGTPVPLGTTIPVPEAASNVEVSPLVPAPSDTAVPPVAETPSTAPLDEDEAPPTTTSRLIALVLPLEVPAYERAASAVRDGFLDAAEAAGARGDCIVIAHGADGVIPAFESARAKNVRVAVGPLVGGAITDSRVLASSERRLLVVASLALAGLAGLGIRFPKLLAWPLAVLSLWIALGLLTRSFSRPRH